MKRLIAAIPLLLSISAWAQHTDISSWNGIPPLPPSASMVQTEKSQAHCGVTDTVGHEITRWMTRADCQKWIAQASEMIKAGPTPIEVFAMCQFEGSVYREAAQYRDSSTSPQDAFRYLKWSYLRALEDQGISEQFIKTAINNVYFDNGFINAGGNALQNQVAEACLHPNGRYKPLQ